MDEDDDLYGGTGDDVKAESTPAVKAENEVDMNGDQEEEEEESDDVRIHSHKQCMQTQVDHCV